VKCLEELSLVLTFAAQYRVGHLYFDRAAAMHVYIATIVRSVNAALDIRPITGLLKFDATVNVD